MYSRKFATEAPASSTEEESGSLRLYGSSGNHASENEKDSTTEESEDGEEADVLAPQGTDTSSVKKSGSGTGTITISAAGDCTLGVDENADESGVCGYVRRTGIRRIFL